MATPTDAELLAAAKSALLRLLNGARDVMMNGRRYVFSSIPELRALITEYEGKALEASGDDGRGGWTAVFDD